MYNAYITSAYDARSHSQAETEKVYRRANDIDVEREGRTIGGRGAEPSRRSVSSVKYYTRSPFGTNFHVADAAGVRATCEAVLGLATRQP